MSYKTQSELAVEEAKNLKKGIEEHAKAYQEFTDKIDKNATAELTQVEHTKLLVDELERLVDENGKVKDGYEDRVNFILNELNKAYGTEYEAIDGIISNYKELKDEINNLIEKKKAQILLEANEEKYAKAIQNKTQAYQDLKKATEELNKEREILNRQEQSIQQFADSDTYPKMLKQLEDQKEKVKNLQDAYETANTTYEEYCEDIWNYETLSTSIVTENKEAQKQAIEKYTKSYEENGIKQQQSANDVIGEITRTVESYIRFTKNTGEELTEVQKQTLNSQLQTLGQKLIEQTGKIEELTPEQILAWQTLAENSEEIYNEKISQIDPDTKIILDMMFGKIDTFSPDYIQKWADMAKNSKEEYELELSNVDENTRQKIQSCVDTINEHQWSAEEASVGLAKAIERGVNTIDTTEAGKESVNGVIKGINANKNSKNLWQAISGVVSNVKTYFKSLLGINSPSKVMAKLAGSVPEGVAKGIEDNIDETVKPIKDLANNITDTFSNNINIPNITKELSQGIKINTNDFAVDTNQYINYSAIKGEILAQGQVSMNENIAEKIAEAVTQSMRNTEVNVNIEAKTEEGVIVNKIKKYEKEYRMRTGQPLFEY